MRAMVMRDFGGPDVFEAQDIEAPEPGAQEVLVRVHASSVNPVDTKIRQAGTWAVDPPAVIGYDVSGVVEAVGDEVTDFRSGDEVFYTPEIFGGGMGSYAEYHAADQAIVARKPTGLSHAEAASLPLAGGTAWDALVTRADVRPGETVLVHGAGGVGSLAIQIARAAGARVLAVCSDYMRQMAQELGADRAIDYKSEDFASVVETETNGTGVDVAFDTVGGDALAESIPITKPHGRFVTILGPSGNLGPAYLKNITLHFLFLERARYKLNGLRALVERDQLRPVVDSTVSLTDVAEAHRRVEAGGVQGKISLEVPSE